jgi:methylmalonyl-CoA/ethylmalonyl-CoA epimerase
VIRRFDHIGIAVLSLEESLPFWADALGMRVAGMETVKDEQVKVAFLTVGNSRIELLEATAPDSPIARSIEKRGPGVHHVTLEVTDLEATLTRLRSRGVSILGDAVRSGAGGRSVAFVHPRSAGGVLVELVQERIVQHDAGELGPGSAVLLYLRDPPEKQWGVLRRLDSTGVIAEALDLGSFDDWIRQIERGDEDVVGPSVIFVPMSRVDKILLDRSSGELPSVAERFERRVGRTVQAVLGGSEPAGLGEVD